MRSGVQALYRSGMWPPDYVPERDLEVILTATPEAMDRDSYGLLIVYIAGARFEYAAKRYSTARALARRIARTMKLTKLPGRMHWRSRS